jgi:hypothetical protein
MPKKKATFSGLFIVRAIRMINPPFIHPLTSITAPLLEAYLKEIKSLIGLMGRNGGRLFAQKLITP